MNDQKCENVGDHRLLITYESVTESSFSEVLLTTVLFSREQCYHTNSFSQPLTRDTPLDEYGPLENGFTVVGINKGDKCFLDKPYDDSAKPSTNEAPDIKYEFPQAVENSKRLILHNPSQEPIKWSLHPPYMPLKSTLSRVDL